MKLQPANENTALRPSGPGNGLFLSERESALLQDGEHMEYQTEIASLLAEKILFYTAGESSSVKEETAFQILGSISYSIDAYKATLDTSDALLRSLREYGVRGMYREGAKIVRSCLKETRLLFENISENRLVVPLAPYNEMIDTAIPEFLKTYDVEFNAQSTTCNMDYPLAFDDISATGVFYMNRYLKNLRLETEFCSIYSQRDILRVLCDYQVKFEIDVTDAPFNLFTLLFEQSVFAELAGNETDGLTVTPEQALKMTEALAGLQSSEIRKRISGAALRMTARLHIEDPDLLTYLHRCQSQLTERVIHANGYGNILNLVLIKGEDPGASRDEFTDGARMEDWKFIRLTELVEECGSTEEKISLILENIRSSKDFIDLLEADCLYGDEFSRLYGSLGDTELAVLGKSIFSDELRQDRLHLSAPLLERYKRNAEQDWQTEYMDFLSLLPEKRKTAVEKLVNDLNVNSIGVF